MIKIVGSAVCAGATVDVDPWVPLKITWDPRPDGRPLYLRVSGSDGGEIELKIDRRTGQLIQLIVIDTPPVIDDVTNPAMPSQPAAFVPIIDRSIWEWDDNPDCAEPRRSVATATCPLRVMNGTGVMALIIGEADPASYIDCGEVRVGVSEDGCMTEISAGVITS